MTCCGSLAAPIISIVISSAITSPVVPTISPIRASLRIDDIPAGDMKRIAITLAHSTFKPCGARESW